MSHELRTPLNSILILGQQLSDNPDGNLTGKQVEFARTIHGAGTDLLNLITDILDLSKIESGTVTVEAEEVFFTNLLDMVGRTFRHEAESRGLSFDVQVDPRLGRSIVTDSKRLQQVLKNLLSNAFKFTSQGGVRLNVSSEVAGGWTPDHPVLSQAGRVVSFEVSDTGIGIPLEKQRIIFEAFQQADASTSRKYGGTGPGPGDQPRAGQSARRRDPAPQHARRRQHVHAVPAAQVRRDPRACRRAEPRTHGARRTPSAPAGSPSVRLPERPAGSRAGRSRRHRSRTTRRC